MHTWRSRKSLGAALAVTSLACVGMFAGCGGDDDTVIAQLLAALTGAQETPAAVTTPASGAATVTLFGTTPTTNQQINVVANTSNLANANVTAAHIHVRSGLSNQGPVILTLHNTATDGPWTGNLAKSFPIGTAAFATNAGAGVNNWGDFITAINEGRSYINFHTNDNVGATNTGAGDMASGEIRGIIASEDFAADLTGAAERPTPVVTSATGKGTVGFNIDRTRLDTVVTFANLVPANVTMAHIHVGTAAEAGGILYTLYTRGPDPVLTTNGFARNLATSSFTAASSPTINVTTEAQALQAIRNGNAYINIHTDAFGGGEIRGQLAAIP